jgi:hypothetical protein
MREKVRRYWVAIAVLVVVATVFILWQRGAQLRLYTSAVITEPSGESVRVQFLMPSDWSVGDPNIGFPDPYKTLIMAKQTRRFGWMPEPIQRLLGSAQHGESTILIYSGSRSVDELDGRVRTQIRQKSPIDSSTFYRARRSIGIGRGYHLLYVSTNESEFKATFRLICDSFRVLPVRN